MTAPPPRFGRRGWGVVGSLLIAGVGADRRVARGRPLEAQPGAARFAERRVPSQVPAHT